MLDTLKLELDRLCYASHVQLVIRQQLERLNVQYVNRDRMRQYREAVPAYFVIQDTSQQRTGRLAVVRVLQASIVRRQERLHVSSRHLVISLNL